MKKRQKILFPKCYQKCAKTKVFRTLNFEYSKDIPEDVMPILEKSIQTAQNLPDYHWVSLRAWQYRMIRRGKCGLSMFKSSSHVKADWYVFFRYQSKFDSHGCFRLKSGYLTSSLFCHHLLDKFPVFAVIF